MFEQENILEQMETEAVEQVETQQVTQESEQDRNFKALRERLKQVEQENKRMAQERENAVRYASEIENRYTRSVPQSHQQEQSLSDDDIPDVAYVKKEIRKAKEELDKERQKLEYANAEIRLATQYPDYRDVLSEENRSLMYSLEPELMASIDANPDVYSRAVATIKAIKTFVQPRVTYSQAQKEIIKTQASKPKSINSIAASNANSPLNQAYNYTGKMSDEESKRVFEEAQRRARGW